VTNRMKKAMAVTLASLSIVALTVTSSPITASAHSVSLHLDRHEINTGWVSNFDGGCQAKARVVYYPGNDQAHFETTVTDPYWFVACRVNTQLHVLTHDGEFAGASHYAMACAVPDTSCASTRLTVGDYYGQTPQLTALVESINNTLESLGLPRSYTRKAAVTGIRVVFTKA
jgi:hypothetical protein